MKKIILINLFTFIFLISTPYILFFSYKKIKKNSFYSSKDYPVYEDKEFSKILFKEFNQTLIKKYRAFLAWKREPVKLNYFNVMGKYNTRKSIGQNLEKSYWFFGGSTMWGTGTSDNGTIPSLFHTKTGYSVFNFGEGDWNSRQSLNQLINVIGDNHKPKAIIFYSGVNDINHGCRIENKSIPTHSREKVIENTLKTNLRKMSTTKFKEFLFEPFVYFKNTNNSENYDCHINDFKANKVADHLINNWYSAYLIAKANKSKFYAILQPNLFTSGSSYDYFNKKTKNILPILKKQNDSIYPLIVKKIKESCKDRPEFCNSFLDGRKWISSDSQVFIDNCHITKEGNEIVVNNIISNLKTF